MGQKIKFPESRQRIDKSRFEATAGLNLSIFSTDIGWFGLWGSGRQIAGLTIGHASPEDVREGVRRMCSTYQESSPTEETDWFPQLRQRLQRYTHGVETDFEDCHVYVPAMTAFQQGVLETTCRIGYGSTVTYSQLAEQSGSPRAARAVGNVMASNRVPIIIPCHRVVAADGKWGGYSAPQGVSLKQRLLQMESEVVEKGTKTGRDKG
jgi:methylated-DNA-[protein]-cysteine S-methyltransferase